jgi:plastocyanin
MSRLAIALSFALASSASAASIAVEVRDASGAPVADAAVYALSAQSAADAKGGRTAAIEQIDREFVPYVSVIQVGTSVTFPNRDSIMHHVYSFSPAKSFEIKLYTGKSPGQIVFDKPGVVTLGCNIHDWMIAYLLVVSTPHFAKTGADGVARLRDLPAGTYELRIWHPQQRAPAEARSLVLDAGSALRADFVLDAFPRKAKYKPPMDRLKY